MKINGKEIILNHYDPAHTDTDISVLFAEADILHTGDTWFSGAIPSSITRPEATSTA